jgi:hypothetical protein
MQQNHCRHPLHSCHGNNGRFLPWNESQLAGLVAQLCWIIDGYDEWHWSFDWSHWVNFVFFSYFVKIIFNSHFSPILVGLLTGNGTINEWRIVFWIAFVVFNVTNLVYVIWASGEIQPWNDGALIRKNTNETDSEDQFRSPTKQIPELKSDSYK